MSDSIFTRIINGEIPCHKVYEDDKTLAFLTINPTQLGHTLVVPKLQVIKLEDLPEADYLAVWQTVHKVSKQIDKQLGRKRIGIQVVGLEVPHAHVHVFPFDTLDQFVHIPNPDNEPDHPALAAMAKRLAF